MSDFRWHLRRICDSAEDWLQTWSAANQDWLAGHPLFDAKFVGPLVKHYGPDELHFARCTLNDSDVGYALLERVGRGRWQAFLPGQGCISHAFFSPTIGQGGAARALASLARALPGIVLLIDFPKQDSAFSVLCKLADSHTHRELAATTCAVQLSTTFDEYWQQRPKRVRQSMRRVEKALAEQGIVATLSTLTAVSDMAQAVRQHGELEASGWKGREGTAIRADNDQGRFYTDVLSRFAEQSGAAAYQLSFGDKLVASLLTIEQRGMQIVLKTAYDEAQRELSPGRFIDYLVMRQLLGRPSETSLEMYTNASPVELQWWPKHRPIEHVTYYRSSWLNRWRRRRRTPSEAPNHSAGADQP
jgi:hypothetical protein